MVVQTHSRPARPRLVPVGRRRHYPQRAQFWPRSFGQATSYSPLWLNVVFNPVAIAMIHHALSAGLLVAALGWCAWSWRRGRAQARLSAAQENVSVQRGAHYPSIDGTANYYFVRPPGILQNVHWDVGVALTVPIFSGG